jgi:hypothetical protein
MRNILNKDWIQRIIYIVGLICIIAIGLKNGIASLNQESSIGLKYWFFLIVPGLIIIYQIILNNKYGWIGIICLYGLYLIWTILRIISEIKKSSDYYVLSNYLSLLLIVMLLLLLGYFLYLIRPIKK